jgi:hypothetical protein
MDKKEVKDTCQKWKLIMQDRGQLSRKSVGLRGFIPRCIPLTNSIAWTVRSRGVISTISPYMYWEA